MEGFWVWIMGLPVSAFAALLGAALFFLAVVFVIARRKLRGFLAAVKEQLFTPASFFVASLYGCCVVGLSGVVFGLQMLF